MPTTGETKADRISWAERLRRLAIAVAVAAVIFWPYSYVVLNWVKNPLLSLALFLVGVGAVVLGSVIYVARPSVWRALLWIWFILISCLALYMVGQPTGDHRDKAIEAEIKQNLHVIQLGLERYAENHEGLYPAAFVVSDLSLPGSDFLPKNFFREDRRLMQPVPFGADEPFGDFTYIAVEDQEGVVGYYLLAYGSERTRGLDVDGDDEGDGVIMVLSSEDGEFDPLSDAGEYSGNLPPLLSLLTQSPR